MKKEDLRAEALQRMIFMRMKPEIIRNFSSGKLMKTDLNGTLQPITQVGRKRTGKSTKKRLQTVKSRAVYKIWTIQSCLLTGIYQSDMEMGLLERHKKRETLVSLFVMSYVNRTVLNERHGNSRPL